MAPLPGGRRAAAGGLVGAVVVIGATAVVHTFLRAVPFLPLALSQALVRAAPGGFATFFIDRLGHWALRLAVTGTVIAFILAGVGLGLLAPRLFRFVRNRAAAGVLSFLPLWLVSVAFYPSPGGGTLRRLPFAVASLPIYGLGGLAAAWAQGRLQEAPGRQEPDPTRRVVLRALWWGAAGVLLGVADLGRLIYRRADPGRQLLHLANVREAASPSLSSSDAAFARVPGLTPEVTPNEDFYVVDEEIIDPDIDAAAWRLNVTGLVTRPLSVTYEELLRLPAVERYQTLECISNQVGGNLISTAKWAGVPLPEILDRAGVGGDAVEVVFRASGGYSDSLAIEQAMDPGTLIAVGMNDHVLPRAHGFPARLLSVGTYGMKNPKWLTAIEVVNQPYQGYWERRGWSKQAIVKTASRIDVPAGGAHVRGAVAVAGIAFAGSRGVSRVEVSTDGGRSWNPAQLKRPLSSVTWRLWLYRGEARGPGESGILVRAYDGRGIVQTKKLASPHPDGASGYDAITVRYESG
ncbi:MAG TPA: molybdopterin-dependent oxidoreductase [Actinomycetota bacterium]|jgi:DMSO/TMAO reductase YedYZ molybdopterin-dependent catalytic subunit